MVYSTKEGGDADDVTRKRMLLVVLLFLGFS
jgi:hypothetical protein